MRWINTFCKDHISTSSLVLFLVLLIGPIMGQDNTHRIIRPGDVQFESPFEKFNLPVSNFQHFNKILLHDSKGFIWLLYEGTLYKYDGYELISYLASPVGPSDLNANFILCMAEDVNGFIWIGCARREGLFRYDPEKEVFVRFPRKGIDPGEISNAEITCILPVSSGNVWIATSNYSTGEGLYIYDHQTDRFREYRHDPGDPYSLIADKISLLYLDKFNNFWVVCGGDQDHNGLFYFDVEKEKFIEFRLEIPGQEPLRIHTRQMKEDALGNLWFCVDRWYNPLDYAYNFLYKISDDRKNLRINAGDSIALFRNYTSYREIRNCNGFDLDLKGDLWLDAGNKGIARLNSQTGKFEYFLPEPNTFPDYNINNVLCDRSGAIWFSYSGGIKRYAPGKRKFTYYTEGFFETMDNEEVSVHSIYEAPDSTLWMGVNRKLLSFDPGLNKLRNYEIHNQPRSNNIGNEINIFIPGDKENLYITGMTCFFIFNTTTGIFDKITHLYLSCNITSGVPSFCMIRNMQKMIWVGVYLGCLVIDPVNKTSEYLFMDDSTSLFTGGVTYGIVEDQYRYIWMGTEFGLNRYDPLNKTSTKILFDPYNPNGLASQKLRCLLLDHLGNLWIGYESSGLSCLDAKYINETRINPDSLIFRHYSLNDGLPDLHINNLTEDNSGNIWMSTYLGLSRLNPVTGKITSFNKEDGIQVSPFISNFYKNPETGEIFIGGKRGMISFQPDSIPENKYVPPVQISGFRLHNKSVTVSDTTVLKQSITYSERLDLAYDENFLQFTFAALDYTNPEKNQYRYFMDGVDPDTVFAGTTRTAEYRNLRPGRYTFWVTGSNNDGLWNPEGTKLEIYIHPPWYSSNFARGSYVMILLLMIAGYIRLRTERLRKEKVVLEREVALRTAEIRQKNEQITEMEQLKTRFFTDVSHEIRTPLSLITGPLDNLIRQDNPDPASHKWLTMIRRNSQRLHQLVNQLLDISRLDSGHMKLVMEKSDVLDHLRLLVNEFQSLAESRRIRFIIDIPDRVLNIYNDREKLDKIITNLLSNAFKFTPETGTVACRIRILKNKKDPSNETILRIIVADTGPGIPTQEREKIFERFYRGEGDLYEDAGGTGIGLSLTRELIKILHGEVAVKSLIGTGAVFIVSIPLGIEHLEEKEYLLKEPGITASPEEVKAIIPVKISGDKKTADQNIQVLIVEDNEDLRIFIRDNLSQTYRISEALEGKEGLVLAQKNIPDLIITDVMMPGMDGMELCRILKNDERTSHIPIIMLTAKATGKDKIEGLERGADDYIFKPFSIEELKVRIKNLLEQRERLRKHFSAMIGMDWGAMSVTTLDEKFLKKVTDRVTEHMHEFDFNVGVLQKEMIMSRGHLFKKLKALTGESPTSLIRVMRLKTAASFIEKGEENITRISLNVGFSNPSYFARRFKEYFGKSPGEFRKEIISGR